MTISLILEIVVENGLKKRRCFYVAYTGDESHDAIMEHVDGKVIASIIGWEA